MASFDPFGTKEYTSSIRGALDRLRNAGTNQSLEYDRENQAFDAVFGDVYSRQKDLLDSFTSESIAERNLVGYNEQFQQAVQTIESRLGAAGISPKSGVSAGLFSKLEIQRALDTGKIKSDAELQAFNIQSQGLNQQQQQRQRLREQRDQFNIGQAQTLYGAEAQAASAVQGAKVAGIESIANLAGTFAGGVGASYNLLKGKKE